MTRGSHLLGETENSSPSTTTNFVTGGAFGRLDRTIWNVRVLIKRIVKLLSGHCWCPDTWNQCCSWNAWPSTLLRSPSFDRSTMFPTSIRCCTWDPRSFGRNCGSQCFECIEISRQRKNAKCTKADRISTEKDSPLQHRARRKELGVLPKHRELKWNLEWLDLGSVVAA